MKQVRDLMISITDGMRKTAVRDAISYELRKRLHLRYGALGAEMAQLALDPGYVVVNPLSDGDVPKPNLPYLENAMINALRFDRAAQELRAKDPKDKSCAH